MEAGQVGSNGLRLPSPEEWDAFVSGKGGHLLQSWGWGEFKRRFGWEAARFVAWDAAGTELTGVAQVLLRDLPLGKMAYVPKGPVADAEDAVTWKTLLTELHDFGRKRGASFLKIEPDVEGEPPLAQLLAEHGFRRAKRGIQPSTTIVVSLNGDPEEILTRMKSKGRYNTRLAERKGVTVREGEEEDIPLFYELLEETRDRDAFAIHNEEYYRQAWRIFAPRDHAKLFLAYYGRELLAGLMAFAMGCRAWYLYGASSSQHRNLMPNHLLQWRAMCWAKERGCTTYDLWGIPDEAGSGREDMEAVLKRGGLWGVYRFKRSFGGRVARYSPSYDYVYSPLLYWLGTTAAPWLARLGR
ncbi:MAG: peptidoglycan bridge formation glycyltransferase FemA/FemB family protein [Anaerolineae bacterium]